MNEIITGAFVIDKDSRGEHDDRVVLYTQELGLIDAKATSSRKITSKLSAHLEPLVFSQIRLVKKNNFQIADALSYGTLPKTAEVITLLQCVKAFFAPEEPDAALWQFLIDAKDGHRTPTKSILESWGFDPLGATCGVCNSIGPRYFSPQGHFVCDQCERINSSRLLLDATAYI